MTEENIRDLSSFKKDMPWDKRVEMIRGQFPNSTDMQWKKVFDQNEDIFARIMRDILKVDQAVPGRPGPRPALEYDQGMETLKRLMGQDFCTAPFTEAFSLIAGGRSISHIANKVGLSRSHCYRLMKGDVTPTIGDLQAVAEGFGKHPSFFAEYRAAFVIAHLEAKLMQAPESTIDFYRRITRVTV